MVNGVSMVVYDGEWCFNGRVCMMNGVSMVASAELPSVTH